MLDLLYLLETLVPKLEESIEIIGCAMLILGFVDAFFGYKLFNIVLAIIGFITGAFVGFMVFLDAASNSGGSDTVMAYMLIGGFIGSALAKLFYELGIFLVVGAMGVCIAFLVTQHTWVSVVFGIICGIVSVFFEKYVLIITTALFGGSLSAMGIWFIRLSNGENQNIQAIGWLIGICGILCQLFIEKKTSKNEELGFGGSIVAVVLYLLLEVAEFIAAFVCHFYKFAKHPIKNLHNLITKEAFQGTKQGLIIMALIFIPVNAALVLGILFKSFLFGLGVITVIDIFLMLFFIRKYKAKNFTNKNIRRFAWEKRLDKYTDSSVFIIFMVLVSPVIPGFFILALLSVIIDEELVIMLSFLIGTVGTYFIFLKSFFSLTPNRATSSSVLNNTDSAIQQSNMTPEVNTIQCSKCGAILAQDSIFCGQCGFNVQEKLMGEYLFCSKCGTKLPCNARFCTNCGVEQK